MDKVSGKVVILILIIISILFVSVVLNFVYTERVIEDELTGYEYTNVRWFYGFYPMQPRLTLVFGESEIYFEMSSSRLINHTPLFGNYQIQDFKNNVVNVYYKENIYGHKIVDDIQFVEP